MQSQTSQTTTASDLVSSIDLDFLGLSSYPKRKILWAFLSPFAAKSSQGSFFQKQTTPSIPSSADSGTAKITAASGGESCSGPGLSLQPITATDTQAFSEDVKSHTFSKMVETKKEGCVHASTDSPDRISSFDSSREQQQGSNSTASTLYQPDIEKQEPPHGPLEHSGPSIEDSELEPWKAGRSEWLVMITMAVCCLTVALDSTILVPVLPTLALELHGTTAEAFWTGTSYLLASAVVQPFTSTLSDIFGRRPVTLVSVGLFAIASIICAVSRSFPVLLTGRVIQGIGGGGIISQSQVVFADIVPLRQRPRYFSLVLGSWAIGSMLGPLIGGAFVESANNWRWCFYLNLPICGISIAMCAMFLRLTTNTNHQTSPEKWRSVDWIGGFLFVSSLTSFLIAVSWGGVMYAWDSWHTLLPLVSGLVGIILAVLYQWRNASSHPFIAKALFCNKSSIIAYLSALFQGLVLFMALYYVSFYMAAAKFKSPIAVGTSLLPATVLLMPGSIICSQLITRFGVYRPFMWMGWATTTLGAGMMIHWKVDTPTPFWAASLCVLGLGLGATLSCLTFAVQASTTQSQSASSAAAMYAFMRSLGMSLGVAVGSTVFQNLMKQSLRSHALDEAIAANAESWVYTTLRYLPAAEGDTVRTAALDAYVYGFRGVWITMTGISACALLAAFAVKQYSMDRILEAKAVARQ